MRESYTADDVWKFLNNHKKSSGGHRPFIIAFINRPLKSSRLSNLFGSHEAKDGLAVVTIHNSAQYIKEEKRYCCYYLVRYSLSFINPSIKSHVEPERSNCYFHKKLYKPDIRKSMDSGFICDECSKQIDNPPDDGVSRSLSVDERKALYMMMELVKGDFPHAIVMKGGGVKGLAFAAALIELENYYWFDCHVGTSAGAITAVLLAANYSPADLVEILKKKNFREFMDAKFWKTPFNLFINQGLFPGEHFRMWIANLLAAKVNKLSEIKMSDLEKGAVIYGCRQGPGTLVFDSNGERKDTVAAFATRCSMSIPIFFYPQNVDNRKVYDGGLRNNFPLQKFVNDHPNKPFIALYLGKRDDSRRGMIGTDLFDIVLEGEERGLVDANLDHVVVIDTTPIGTVDFGLRDIEKDFLLKIGRASALKFLRDRNFDDGPDEDTVNSAQTEAEELRSAVCRIRAKSRNKRIIAGVSLITIIYTIYYYRETLNSWLVTFWDALVQLMG